MLEKRILQLCPNHPLPVTQEMVFSHVKTETPISLKVQMAENECEKLQKDLYNLQVKYDELNELYQKEIEEKKQNLEKITKETPIVFPSVERVTSEQIFEAYSQLYEAYKKMFIDKDQIITSLKNEVLIVGPPSKDIF